MLYEIRQPPTSLCTTSNFRVYNLQLPYKFDSHQFIMVEMVIIFKMVKMETCIGQLLQFLRCFTIKEEQCWKLLSVMLNEEMSHICPVNNCKWYICKSCSHSVLPPLLRRRRICQRDSLHLKSPRKLALQIEFITELSLALLDYVFRRTGALFGALTFFHFSILYSRGYLPGFNQILTEHLFECGIQCYLEKQQVHEELLGEVKENGFDV